MAEFVVENTNVTWTATTVCPKTVLTIHRNRSVNSMKRLYTLMERPSGGSLDISHTHLLHPLHNTTAPQDPPEGLAMSFLEPTHSYCCDTWRDFFIRHSVFAAEHWSFHNSYPATDPAKVLFSSNESQCSVSQSPLRKTIEITTIFLASFVATYRLTDKVTYVPIPLLSSPLFFFLLPLEASERKRRTKSNWKPQARDEEAKTGFLSLVWRNILCMLKVQY